MEIVSVGGGFGDAIGVATLGDDVAARVVAPGFPAGRVAHGGAAADGIGSGERGRAAADGRGAMELSALRFTFKILVAGLGHVLLFRRLSFFT